VTSRAVNLFDGPFVGTVPQATTVAGGADSVLAAIAEAPFGGCCPQPTIIVTATATAGAASRRFGLAEDRVMVLGRLRGPDCCRLCQEFGSRPLADECGRTARASARSQDAELVAVGIVELHEVTVVGGHLCSEADQSVDLRFHLGRSEVEVGVRF